LILFFYNANRDVRGKMKQRNEIRKALQAPPPHTNSTYVSEKINSTKTLQFKTQNPTFTICKSKITNQKMVIYVQNIKSIFCNK